MFLHSDLVEDHDYCSGFMTILGYLSDSRLVYTYTVSMYSCACVAKPNLLGYTARTGQQKHLPLHLQLKDRFHCYVTLML